MYTEEQLAFINYNGTESLILSAIAGSGKTHCTVGRLNKLIESGTDPNRIIFFSFTNDAVNELRARIKHDVKITTIHSYTSSLLGKMGLFKPIVTFYDFAAWYKEKYKPHTKTPVKLKVEYANTMEQFYEEGAQISATFSAYKLQNAEGIRVPKPKYYDAYAAFIKEKQVRDFSDMLIDTEKLSRKSENEKYFKNTYDYVFVDEYQDTSTMQMRILLKIEAKQYHLIGDKFQAIYGFSGANCDAIEHILKEKYPIKELTLTKNFRSHKSIVDHANNYSNLKGTPNTDLVGHVHKEIITEEQLYDMMLDGKPLTILARTNYVVKEIEKYGLKNKLKMKYFNYISQTDIDHINKNNINPSIKKRLDAVVPYHRTTQNLLKFIEENNQSNVFVTTIHKSKGREFPRCVVVNSVDPDFFDENDDTLYDYSYKDEMGRIDEEARNVHYVAVTRPKEELYFLIYEH